MAAAVVVCSPACGSDVSLPPYQGAVDRAAVLADVADHGILPLTGALATRTSSLALAAEALCAAPSQPELRAARRAWAGAREAYRASQAFGFGPVDELRLARAMDFAPLRLDAVAELLASDEPITPALLAQLGATVRGFGVLERYLFDPYVDDAEVLLRLQEDLRRCEYVVALAQDLAESAGRLDAAWRPDSGGFRDALARAGADPRGFSSQQAALAAVLGGLVGATLQAEEALAKPLGRLDGGVPQPDAALALYSAHGLMEIRAWLVAVQALYVARGAGPDAVALADLVAAVDTPLSQLLQDELTTAVAALDAISLPLDRAVLTQPEVVEAARAAAHAVLLRFAVDVSALLSVTLTFSDNDGD
ncbi:MAG: imelysin family protein [Myxococcales bacterium]|nr:imelysin family protein [Myxococcales bacterium]